MKIITSISELEEKIAQYADQEIGFVPTMGFLHEGHLSLVEEAKKENDIVVMSIFVNPLQFGPDEDFERYPRDTQKDSALAEAHGVDILFLPQVDDMYPENFVINMAIKSDQTDVLCGRSRTGHFDGVITVLTKLFHLVQPTNAYFGLKDAQQFAVVDTLINQLNFPINLVGIPTVRESDGLAKSSRNVYLSKAERAAATHLNKALHIGQELFLDGVKNPVMIINEVREHILTTSSGQIDYVELLRFPSLTTCDQIEGQVIIAVAVQFEKARLIDNIILTSNGQAIGRIN